MAMTMDQAKARAAEQWGPLDEWDADVLAGYLAALTTDRMPEPWWIGDDFENAMRGAR